MEAQVVSLHSVMPTYTIIQASITVLDEQGKTRVISGKVLHTEDGLVLLGSQDFRNLPARDDWHVGRKIRQAA